MRAIIALGAAALLSACASTPKSFYADRAGRNDTELCRVFETSADEQFKRDVATELISRGLTPEDCVTKIQTQNAALTVIAVGAAAVAGVAIANSGGIGSGGWTSGPVYPYGGSDWDEFYNAYGQLVWACREIATGQFTELYHCNGLAKTDARWPGKFG